LGYLRKLDIPKHMVAVDDKSKCGNNPFVDVEFCRLSTFLIGQQSKAKGTFPWHVGMLRAGLQSTKDQRLAL
jgi:hypothetical protein